MSEGERKETPTKRRKAERRYNMAEKKMTRVEALNIALETVENVEAREVLKKMVEQLSKPRKKNEGPSKAHRENEKLAAEMVAAITEKGEPVTSKWVCEHVRFITTPQKCTAVARIAIENGELVRIKEGKVITYAVPDAE